MSYAHSLAVLSGVFLLGAMSPGPNFVLISGIAARSRASGFAVAIGFCLAALTWATMSALGLAAILIASGWAYRGIQVLGGTYLVYSGYKLVRGGGNAVGIRTNAQPPAGLAAVRKGYLVNIANAKSAAFYTSVFATLLPRAAPFSFAVLAVLLTALVSLSWYSLVAMLFSVNRIGDAYRKATRVTDRLAGTVLALLGTHMIISG